MRHTMQVLAMNKIPFCGIFLYADAGFFYMLTSVDKACGYSV